jgi:hypothetical protein
MDSHEALKPRPFHIGSEVYNIFTHEPSKILWATCDDADWFIVVDSPLWGHEDIAAFPALNWTHPDGAPLGDFEPISFAALDNAMYESEEGQEYNEIELLRRLNAMIRGNNA